ncbi:MAG: polysaccharide deacetylase family protein [Candidatus Marinimicrobia bacterium]|nr:polysaccharide deacetylase family protein [Candidatus Neomarinimicrobiota bacterium]
MKDYLILAYHRILPEKLASARGSLTVNTVQFDKQISYLVRKGWRSLTLSEFYHKFILQGLEPKKVFVITFDDGYQDNYLYAFPILKKYNVKATIFLVANMLETSKNLYFTDVQIPYEISDVDRSLRQEQIKEMQKYGIEFGSHTLTHARLDSMELDSVKHEIRLSKINLESYLNTKVNTFCYPYGALNDKVIELVKESGYQCAVVTPPRSGIIETAFTLYRSGIYLSDSFIKFKLKCTDLFYTLRRTNLWFSLKK